MLTLQELKGISDVPGCGTKLPTAKQLRESGVAVAQERLGQDSEIFVYQSGYVLYRVGNHSTVFPLHSCRDYLYLSGKNAVHLSEQFFCKEEWYLRLILEGEDRLSRNHEEKERSWNVPYSAISEDWAAMESLTESVIEQLVKWETVISAGRNTGADFRRIRHQSTGGICNNFPGNLQYPEKISNFSEAFC